MYFMCPMGWGSQHYQMQKGGEMYKKIYFCVSSMYTCRWALALPEKSFVSCFLLASRTRTHVILSQAVLRQKNASLGVYWLPPSASVHICLPLSASVQICLPLSASVHINLPLSASVRICLPLSASA